MRTKRFLSSLLAIALLVGLTVSCEDEFRTQPQDNDSNTLKKGALYPTVTVVDADWLDVELVSAVAGEGGIYTFIVTWTLTPEADLDQLVKTQGGLTAKVGVPELSENLLTPWKKQPKKNFIIYGEEEGLLVSDPVGDGAIEYTVTFTKLITALSGEEVGLTGDWTSKWKDAVPVLLDPDGIPGSGDEYYEEHQVGYADPVMWTVPI